MKQTITREHIKNKDVLWRWVKRELETDNVESIEYEFIGEDVVTEEGFRLGSSFKGATITIKLGSVKNTPVIIKGNGL